MVVLASLFFFNDTATTEIYTLSLHDALPISCAEKGMRMTEQRRVLARVLQNSADHPDVAEPYRRAAAVDPNISVATVYRSEEHTSELQSRQYLVCRFLLAKKKHTLRSWTVPR